MAFALGETIEAIVLDEDDDLAQRARGGDSPAFDRLVRAHQPRVIRFARHFLGDDTLAPDVSQNAFLALWFALETYQPSGHFPAFLYRIVHRQCLMEARRRRSWRRLRAALLSLPAPPSSTPHESAVAAERAESLRAAVRTLPEEKRAVVLLRFVAEMGDADIALALGIPEGTVKSRFHDAKSSLRRLLKEEE